MGLICLLVACDKTAELLEKPPESVLASYMDAMISGNWADAYRYISAQDKTVKSLSKYKAEATEANQLAAVVASKTSYKIIGIEKSGDTVTAYVEISLPDLSELLADLIKSAFLSAFGEGDITAEDMEAKLKERAESGDFPLRTERQKFTLLREEDGWRVFLDWGTKEKIASLVAEAEKLREQKNSEARRRNMMRY